MLNVFGMARDLLLLGIKYVSELRYVLAVVAVVAAVAMSARLVPDHRVAVFGAAIVLVGTVLTWIVIQLLRNGEPDAKWAARVFLWFSLMLVMATLSLLFSAAFLRRPFDLGVFPSTPKVSDSEGPQQDSARLMSAGDFRAAMHRHYFDYHLPNRKNEPLTIDPLRLAILAITSTDSESDKAFALAECLHAWFCPQELFKVRPALDQFVTSTNQRLNDWVTGVEGMSLEIPESGVSGAHVADWWLLYLASRATIRERAHAENQERLKEIALWANGEPTKKRVDVVAFEALLKRIFERSYRQYGAKFLDYLCEEYRHSIGDGPESQGTPKSRFRELILNELKVVGADSAS